MGSTRSLVVLFLTALTLVSANNEEIPAEEVSEKTMADCVQEFDFHCMKLRALANVYHLVKSKSLDVVDGISLQYSADRETEAATARALVDQDWGNLLFDLVPRFMRSLSLKLSMFPGGNLVVKRSHKDNGLVSMSVEAENSVGEGRKYGLFLVR